jgi:tetratricopeptide (TPR) repeat protein
MTEKKNSSYKDGVIIGGKEKKQKRFTPRVAIFAVVLLAIIIIVVSLIFTNFSGQDGPTKEQLDIAKIEDIALTDLQKAKKQYQEFIDQQEGPTQKAKYMEGKGNLCLSYKDYKCAVASYEAASKIAEESFGAVYSKGTAYEKLGDKKKAKESYEKVKLLIKDLSEDDIWFDKEQLDADINRVDQ